MADAPERIMITEAGIPVPCEPNESGGRLPEYVRADHYAELREAIDEWSQACDALDAFYEEPWPADIDERVDWHKRESHAECDVEAAAFKLRCAATGKGES